MAMQRIKKVLSDITALNQDAEFVENIMLKIYTDLSNIVQGFESVQDYFRSNPTVEAIVNDILFHVSTNSTQGTTKQEKWKMMGSYLEEHLPGFVGEKRDPNLSREQNTKNWFILNQNIDPNHAPTIHAGFFSIFLVE